MKLRRRPQREHPETIVALIDVVFFLLVFFMIVGRMDATAPFRLMPPKAQTGTPMPGGGATLAIAADGALALDGQATDRAALLGALADRIAARPDLLLRVNADAGTPLDLVLPLVGAVKDLGARDIVLVVARGAP